MDKNVFINSDHDSDIEEKEVSAGHDDLVLAGSQGNRYNVIAEIKTKQTESWKKWHNT